TKPVAGISVQPFFVAPGCQNCLNETYRPPTRLARPPAWPARPPRLPAMLRRYSPLALLVFGLGISSALAQPRALEPADCPIEQVIDHCIDAELKEAAVQPAAPASNAELLRRLTLDLNGRIPTVAEMDRYLADADPHKKVQLVERLLASPLFVQHQVQEFAALLQSDDAPRKGPRKTPLHDYLQRSFAENRSWDRIFRDLLVPDDADPKLQGAGEFLKSRV